MFGLGGVSGTFRLRHAELQLRHRQPQADLRRPGGQPASRWPPTSRPGAGGTLTLRAHARIDRYAYGITAGKGLAGRRLNVSIDAPRPPRASQGRSGQNGWYGERDGSTARQHRPCGSARASVLASPTCWPVTPSCSGL